MAKIFSSIAKVTPPTAANPTPQLNPIRGIYNNSSVVSTQTTFVQLRNRTTTAQQQPAEVFKRIDSIYKIYTSTPATSSVTFNSQTTALLTLSEYRRNRTTGLYYGFRTYEPTIPAFPPRNFTLIEIKPDDIRPAGITPTSGTGSFAESTIDMLQNSQAYPVISGQRDVNRVSRFLTSFDGIRFLAFQARLQGGNTFAQSRLYDIRSIGTATVNYRDASLFNPLQRSSRISFNQYTDDYDIIGRIQKETVVDVQKRIRDKFRGVLTSIDRTTPVTLWVNAALGQTFRNLASGTRAPRFLTNIIGLPAGSSFESFFNQWGNVEASINTILNTITADNATLMADQTAYDALYVNNIWPLTREYNSTNKIRNFHAEKAAYLIRAKQALENIKGQQINNLNRSTDAYGTPNNPLDDYRSSVDFTEIVRTAVPAVEFNGIATSRYIQDPMNIQIKNGSPSPILDAQELESTTESDNENRDLILLKFVVPSVFDTGINFRAFIEDLNHTSKGEYENIKYVGRPERFVTYKGSTRTLTFSMYLVAFGINEIDTIWTRANMLNKLVYPINNFGGYMVPPLVRLTIGSMIVDQPGYVENVDMRFANIPWDIDKELPMAIKLNMTYSILEKDYITQAWTNPLTHIQLFNQKTDPANRYNASSTDPSTPPPASPPPPAAPTERDVNASRRNEDNARGYYDENGLQQRGQSYDEWRTSKEAIGIFGLPPS